MDGVCGQNLLRAPLRVPRSPPSEDPGAPSSAMAPKRGTRVRLGESHCTDLIAQIRIVLGRPHDGRLSDVDRLSTIFVFLGSLIMDPDPDMITELTQIFLGTSTGAGYYRYIAGSIEQIMEDRSLSSNMRKITVLMGFAIAFAGVVRLPWSPRRPAQSTQSDFTQNVHNLAILMKINLWTLMEGSPPREGDEMRQAMERDYVFFTATQQAVEMEAALTAIQQAAADVRAEPSAPAPPPAGGEPDAEPVSHYDTMMQHFRTVAPDWTDQEIADHIELMDVDPFIDDVKLFLESMD
jgi:preprotein translocase subunit SecG